MRRRLEVAEGRASHKPSIPLSSLIYRLLAFSTIASLARQLTRGGGCFTFARVPPPLPRISCARSLGSARASAFAPNTAGSNVPSPRYLRHQRVRFNLKMSSSDDTPLVKASNGGESAFTQRSTCHAPTSCKIRPTRRSPNLAVEASFTSVNLLSHASCARLYT